MSIFSTPLLRAHAAPLAALALALSAAGCASARPASAPRTTVRVAPVPAPAEAAQNDPLPALPVSQVGNGGGIAARRISNLDVVRQDLPTVLRGLAESFGLDHQIDPGVAGEVSMRLTGVTLGDALSALLAPRGYQFQIDGTVLRVVPTRLETRMFTLDYVSLSRVGVSTTVVQRSLSSVGTGINSGGNGELGGGGLGTGGLGGTGSGIGGLGGAGGGMISSVTVADLWQEIQVALNGLIFEEQVAAAGAPEPAAPVQPVASPGARGGAYSRNSGGRRLIINPIAGIITVTAPPEKLAEVQAYLTTIERSVQRQVLIEAKIVEVSLDRDFEYGINWSLVGDLGGVNLAVGGGGSGATVTIRNETGSDGAINLVLRALESQGEVNVLSSPRVTALNNQPAVFNVTTDEVFFSVTRQPLIGPAGATIGFNTQIIPQQIAVGITLDVIAQIAPDNTITMNVRPAVTDVIAEKSIELEDGTQSTAPVIDRRETDTMVRVRGGETVVIGGLMQTKQTNEETGVPVLRDIPGLGWLFGGVHRRTEKRELVIFITPRIVAGQAQPGS